MGLVRVETRITAPPEVLFDLARSQRAHVATTAGTGERVVAGPDRDLLELGDEVTFEARHFGVRWRMTARVTEMEFPSQFVDEMVRGPFRAFRHEHRFAPGSMVDLFEFSMPLGLGWTERLVAWHLRRFLTQRGEALDRLAARWIG
jgi:ligand-binding SRPBCC domain-containing protein